MNSKSLLAAILVVAAVSCSRKEAGPFGNAKWIGTSKTVLYADYLPQFTISASVEFSEGSSKASLLFGANDPRLMDRNMNILGVENGEDESYIRVELDSAARCINVYRTGYTPADTAGFVFQTLPLADSLIHRGAYRLCVDVALSDLTIKLDGSTVGTVAVGPLGHGGDYIAYPQLSDIGYMTDEGSIATFSGLEVRNLREPCGLLYQDDGEHVVDGEKVIFDPDHGGMPFLRSFFQLKDKKIESATIIATARGIYQLSINGQRVGDEELTPGLSQYNRTHYYQTYDVTELLKGGENEILASLGEGWWSGGLTYGAGCHNYFGDQLALLARLIVKYTDGSVSEVVTDPKNWEVTVDGPVVFASMFQGQVVDSRRSLDRAEWSPAEEMSLEGHLPSETFGATAPRVDDYSNFQLLPQPDGGVTVHQVLTAQSVEEVRPGVYVYDMGQNFAGVPEIHFSGLRDGQQVKFRFAEVKYPALPAYKGNEGMVMLENIRSAMAQDIYVASGEPEETFHPSFTLHGYRFVEITGIDSALPLEDVHGLVLSSVGEFTASYECSNPLVNRLWENIKWSMLSNMVSIPTDCPQRNERMGWSGDISVFSRTAVYLSDVDAFLRRHTRAIRDVQTPEGRMPDVAPVGGAFGGFLWGSAGITVPYECYRQYADTAVLAENYDAMKRYMDYVASDYIDPQSGLFVQSGSRIKFGDLGDWLGPQNGRNDNSALWEAYYIFDLGIMQEVATALGRTEDADAFAAIKAERKEFYISHYLDAETGKAVASSWFDGRSDNPQVDMQSSYVLPLAFGIIDDADLRAKVAANLVRCVKTASVSDNGTLCPPYSLMTGFITTAWISKALSDNGYSDIAYRLLQQTGYPSWLYPVTQGATTIWERLDSYTHKNGFGGNNSMNSFNHYSFGAVGQWLIAYSLGIDRDPSAPGFKHFILHPEVDITGGMTYARGWYDCPNGRIESAWEKVPGGFQYSFTIPEGCSATLILPGRDPQELGPGSYKF